MKLILPAVICLCIFHKTNAQSVPSQKIFSRYDTMRGSITPYRMGWDVLQYDITVQPDILQKSITGKTIMTYYESAAVHTMQIDLQQPLVVDSIVNSNTHYKFTRDSNVCFVYVKDSLAKYKIAPGIRTLTIYYHGKPMESKRAPWDGGLVWRKDSLGRPWVATACQGVGASVWWPCKDHQSDEPDSGVTVHIIVPDTLAAISNGRLKNILPKPNGYAMWNWVVKNPINLYDVTMNIGNYVQWNDTLMGEDGKLDLQYWVLDYNKERAMKQFEQVKPLLHSHEYWFGKYPFYEDSYKLIETPYLGMEHQSGVAYGNKFKNGYFRFFDNTDLSGTGWGMKWDYIIVHESGHEWFGNSITTKDMADMWVHEGFTDYSETLYTETLFGKQAGQEYCEGLRRKIKNDKPIIAPYNVNEEGSGDMYYKGANMINTIRNVMDDDAKFREILQGLNHDFYHQTVTTKQVEEYISGKSGINFSKTFDQYLRTTQIPVLDYYYNEKEGKFWYRWSNCVKGFNLPVVLQPGTKFLEAKEKWKKHKIKGDVSSLLLSLQQRYYITLHQLTAKP